MSPERKKKVKISGEKLPAACTILEDPRDVIRHVHKMSKAAINVTPAHQPPHGPTLTTRPQDMSSVTVKQIQKKPTLKLSHHDELHSKELHHSRKMDSSLAIEALNCDDDYGVLSKKHPKIGANKKLASSTPIVASRCFSSPTPIFGTPQNIFSTFQTSSPMQLRTPTGIAKSSSSPFRFTSFGKMLASSNFESKRRSYSGHELHQWNSRMVQSLSTEDKPDDVINIDDDSQQGGHSDSGVIIDTNES